MKTKKENIVSYTVEELEEMVRAGTTGTDWDRIDRMTQEEINRRAIEDMDELGIAHDWYEEAQPINLQPVIKGNFGRRAHDNLAWKQR